MSRGTFVPVTSAEPSCDRPQGGDKAAGAPSYVFAVSNPPDNSCLWRDDATGMLIRDNDNTPICIDNV